MVPRTNLSQYGGKAARERGEVLRFTALLWTLRWQAVSDQTLANALARYHETNRPRYGYSLARKGWLTRHDVPMGQRLTDGRCVYTITEAGFHWLEAQLREGSQILAKHPYRRNRQPAWSQLQHLLDLQRIALRLEGTGELNMLNWFTEPESRLECGSNETVPDLMTTCGYNGANWSGLAIEYDRTPKDDLRLSYMVQRYAELFRLDQSGDLGRAPSVTADRLIVIVTNDYQQGRYNGFFTDEEVVRVFRNSHTRKLSWTKEKYSAAELIGDRVVVWTLDDLLNRPETLEYPPE